MSVADLFALALADAHTPANNAPPALAIEPALKQLRSIQYGEPLLIDLWNVDAQLPCDEVRKMVQAIRVHWHAHGFCIARGSTLEFWQHAAYDYSQPILHWRSLSPYGGWDVLGAQLVERELDVFRLLATDGRVTVEQVARSPFIFSQRPNFADWRVQRDIVLGRTLHAPEEFNRTQAQRILQKMHQRRLVVRRGNLYQIVRPTYNNVQRRVIRRADENEEGLDHFHRQ